MAKFATTLIGLRRCFDELVDQQQGDANLDEITSADVRERLALVRLVQEMAQELDESFWESL